MKASILLPDNIDIQYMGQMDEHFESVKGGFMFPNVCTISAKRKYYHFQSIFHEYFVWRGKEIMSVKKLCEVIYMIHTV